MTNLQTKVCYVCKQEKEFSDFYKDKYNKKDGITFKCKKCFKELKHFDKHHNHNTEDLEGEIWEDVVGYEGLYKVSNLGRVKSIDRILRHRTCEQIIRKSTLLRQHKDEKGYINCRISKGNKSKYFKVHILVWEAFGKEKRNGRILVVDHKDNDKNNNRFDNLQLLPHRVNTIKDKTFKRLLGANLNKSTGRWFAQIKINKKVNRIGSFETEIEAHEAYVKALIDVETGKGLTNVTKEIRIKKSKYLGVSLVGSGRWRAMINFNNKRHQLGVFDTEEEAAQAYQTALANLQNKAA